MATVYSIVMAATDLLPTGVTELGGPPDGYVWVIRDMRAVNLDTPLLYKNGFRVYSGASSTLWSLPEPFAYSGATFEWHGHQVLGADDTLSVATGETDWQLRVSGYQLTLP